MMATLNANKAPQNVSELDTTNIRKQIDYVMFNGEFADIENRPFPYVVGYIVTRHKL